MSPRHAEYALALLVLLVVVWVALSTGGPPPSLPASPWPGPAAHLTPTP